MNDPSEIAQNFPVDGVTFRNGAAEPLIFDNAAQRNPPMASSDVSIDYNADDTAFSGNGGGIPGEKGDKGDKGDDGESVPMTYPPDGWEEKEITICNGSTEETITILIKISSST